MRGPDRTLRQASAGCRHSSPGSAVVGRRALAIPPADPLLPRSCQKCVEDAGERRDPRTQRQPCTSSLDLASAVRPVRGARGGRVLHPGGSLPLAPGGCDPDEEWHVRTVRGEGRRGPGHRRGVRISRRRAERSAVQPAGAPDRPGPRVADGRRSAVPDERSCTAEASQSDGTQSCRLRSRDGPALHHRFELQADPRASGTAPTSWPGCSPGSPPITPRHVRSSSVRSP